MINDSLQFPIVPLEDANAPALSIIRTSLEGVVLVRAPRAHDARGAFEETWSRRAFQEAGLDIDFVQDNHSISTAAGTLRGLHCQAPPHAQDKLVRCTRGAVYDVAVDIRRGSSTYGRWTGAELSPENGWQMFVPKGFLHGFVTLTPDAEVQYKCSALYAPQSDTCVLWNSLGISWPISGAPILSVKDEGGIPFPEFVSPFECGDEA